MIKMSIVWRKVRRTISAAGTTIVYEGPSGYSIESRKRHIPHANGIGSWDYTSYFVLKDGVELAERHSLADAKEYAEKRR